ncbi:MAG: ECF transporter S component [Firmicutes bacterium]|nr:ECF transporter S component [Bacillota bacterium]
MIRSGTTSRLVRVALLGAMAALFMRFIHFPLFPPAPYLKYDPGDLPVVLAALTMGPVATLEVVVLKEVLALLFIGHPLGILMNTVVSMTMGGITALWMRNRPLTAVQTAFATGGAAVVCTAVMVPVNLFEVPFEFGTPRAAVAAMILPIYVPFNLIKGMLTAVLAVLLVRVRVVHLFLQPVPLQQKVSGQR